MEPIVNNTITESVWTPSFEPRGLNTSGIIGLILATASLFLLIVLAIYCSFKRRSSRLPAADPTQNYQVAMSNKLLIVSNLLIINHYNIANNK